MGDKNDFNPVSRKIGFIPAISSHKNGGFDTPACGWHSATFIRAMVAESGGVSEIPSHGDSLEHKSKYANVRAGQNFPSRKAVRPSSPHRHRDYRERKTIKQFFRPYIVSKTGFSVL
ncbi:hypothetical protein [Sinomicrobium pectinilyticum]|uniref:hypothetical protein n=1 Tax=Sinomicrobium pectinilyticum TaxID=1084421 RepID=UPI0011CEB2C3|nr:hypothetical protein [Sinomicrobium pectinilyticum]